MSHLVQDSVASLRRFAAPKEVYEVCELCSARLDPEHEHLVEPPTRRLVCACQACALLFSERHDAKFRRVPQRGKWLPDFHLTDAQWNALLVPIGLAFFFRNSVLGRVAAVYPSPAGPTESLLEFDAWNEIVLDNPVLGLMEPDVEALLVHRVGRERLYFLAPIDKCYQLVGVIRMHWRGLSGGTHVWREINAFFASLRRHAKEERSRG